MIERKQAQTYVMLGITLPAILVVVILRMQAAYAKTTRSTTILPIAEPKVVMDLQPIASAQKTEEDKSRQRPSSRKPTPTKCREF